MDLGTAAFIHPVTELLSSSSAVVRGERGRDDPEGRGGASFAVSISIGVWQPSPECGRRWSCHQAHSGVVGSSATRGASWGLPSSRAAVGGFTSA